MKNLASGTSIWVGAVGAAVFAEIACAANTWFARDMPISRMNKEDVNIMQSAVFEALDTAADGEMRHWQNPKTNARGDITLRSSFMDSGMPCRDLDIENSAGGLTNRSALTLCKTADGWKIK